MGTIKGNASALHMLWRGRVLVPGRRGCCARQGPEGRHLHENQSRRNYLRESGWVSGWVGGVKGVGTRQKGLCMAVCERIAKMRGRMSVGGMEEPALCCHPRCSDHLSNPINYTLILPS